MRNVYFILLGLALIALIFLVDWREKFDAIRGHRPDAEPAGELVDPSGEHFDLTHELVGPAGELAPLRFSDSIMKRGGVEPGDSLSPDAHALLAEEWEQGGNEQNGLTAFDPEEAGTELPLDNFALSRAPRSSSLPIRNRAPARTASPRSSKGGSSAPAEAERAPLRFPASMKQGGAEAFRDVPEQPYLEESRQLLRQIVRNYEKISPAPAAKKQPEHRP
jgi:hypothetical protein